MANSPVLDARLRQVEGDFHRPNISEVGRLALQYYAHRLLFRPKLYWPLMNLYRFLSQMGLAVGSSSSDEFALDLPKKYAMSMSAFQKNLLQAGLAQAAANIAHRRQLADFYSGELRRVGQETPKVPENSQVVLVRYPVQVKDKVQKLSLARENHLEIGDWFVSPLHPLSENWEKLGYRSGTCPVAEALCNSVVNLPTHRGVTQEEAAKGISLILSG